MKIEVREDSVLITGYVNAVERYSKPITGNLRGAVRTFIEKIKSGVFKRALEKNDDVKVLLNHDDKRELANTKDGTAKLYEDNIGLRAEVEVREKDVIEMAKNDELTGWSFGFRTNDDEIGKDGNMETRTINDLELVEVSILNKGHNPAYYGTSIEARESIEVRETFEEIDSTAIDKHTKIESEAMDKHEEIYKESEQEHQKVEEERLLKKMELLAEMVANKLADKFNLTPKEPTEPRSLEEYENRLKNLERK